VELICEWFGHAGFFSGVTFIGYAIDSLLDERTERSVEIMFADIDDSGSFVETLVLNAAKRMKEQGGENIVFVNSNTAYRAIPD
jgi:hypothetical protein